ncbi:MAG: DNA polymerase III subunit delta [Candidatus Nomurabacteria bacterium]|nr:DNA polymerase III subunit delta [Candidatus Nomurabacteria bacterium]
MIKVFFGDGSFELERMLERTTANCDAEVERLAGDSLTKNDLLNILQGTSLFTDKRLVVVRHLSDNTEVWEQLAETSGSDNDIILVETKLDKRSKVYKNLQRVADLQEFGAYSERDAYKIQQWLKEEAKLLGLELNNKIVQYLTEVVGLNQWQLAQALDKLSLLDEEITTSRIDEIVEPSIEQGVFGIFEAAVQGKTKHVVSSLDKLELVEEPQKLLGLFISQALNLAALVFSGGKTPADVAAELGVHPFVMSNLKKVSDQVSKPKMRKILGMFNQTDREIKTASVDAWLAVKNLLVRVSKL